MSTLVDAIASLPQQAPARLFYALGVLLDAADFSAEQSYHRGRLARAFKYLFGTGTVAGLRVEWSDAGQQLTVQPGLALDPLGRLIEIARPVSVRLRGGPGSADSWFEHVRGAGITDAARTAALRQDLIDACTPTTPRNLIADVFVRHVACEHARAPAFATGPFSALEAASAARLRDGYEVALVVRPEAHTAAGAPLPDDLRLLATHPSDTPENGLHWHRQRILHAWRDNSEDWDESGGSTRPKPLEEHLAPRSTPIQRDPTEVGRDPTSVLLARLSIPVGNGNPPADLGTDPSIDNSVRRFIRGSGVYTQRATGGP